MDELLKTDLCGLSELLSSHAVSSSEVTEKYLDNIEKEGKIYGAYLTVCAEEAKKSAEIADKRLLSGEKTPFLSGISYAVKDNICTKGIKTTAASLMLKDFVPVYSASVYEKLQSGNAVLLGKTNLDEFAMGSSTENSAFQATVNPFDTRRSPGGSSGGSACAVASFEAVFALGSDTGGSVRQPAAYCGLVGMMPTYGRVSRYGLIPFASSLDKIGPITRTVRDNRAVFREIAFPDEKDATSVNGEAIFSGSKEPKKIRIGFDEKMLSGKVSEAVGKNVARAVRLLEANGMETVPVSLPSFNDALTAYYIISSSEAFSNLSRYDGIRYGYRPEKEFSDISGMYSFIRETGFGSEVKRRLVIGENALSVGFYDEYYKKARNVRNKLKKEFSDIFGQCDVFISPVAPDTAPLLGEKAGTPEEIYRSDVFTVPESLASLPALSLPCGSDEKGLPVGMQIVGPAFSEDLLYNVGEFFEKTSGISFYSFLKENEK